MGLPQTKNRKRHSPFTLNVVVSAHLENLGLHATSLRWRPRRNINEGGWRIIYPNQNGKDERSAARKCLYKMDLLSFSGRRLSASTVRLSPTLGRFWLGHLFGSLCSILGLLLEDPGMRQIGDLGYQRQVIASE